MKYSVKMDESQLQRHKLTWLLSFYYVLLGIVATVISSFIITDMFANVVLGIFALLVIDVVAVVLPVYLLIRFGASRLILFGNVGLTVVFVTLTLAGGEFFRLFALVYGMLMAVIMALYGWQDAPKNVKGLGVGVVTASAVILLVLFAVVVFYVCPVEKGVSYALKGDHYIVTKVKNAEKILIADTVNGKKVSGVQRGVLQNKSKCKELYIPSTVSNLQPAALYGTNKLEKLTFNPSGVKTDLPAPRFGELWSTGSGWLNGDGNIIDEANTVAMPESITSLELVISGNVPEKYFYGVYNITKAGFEKGCRTLGGNAFTYCVGLTEVTSIDTVTEMGVAVFAYCKNLKTMAKMENMIAIGNCAFQGCTSLVEVYFPGCLDKVGSFIFIEGNFFTKVNVVASKQDIAKNPNWMDDWNLDMKGNPIARNVNYQCDTPPEEM